MILRRRIRDSLRAVAMCVAMLSGHAAFGQLPPLLNTVFPIGAQDGQTVEVTVAGSNLQSLRTLQCSAPGIRIEKLDASRFRLTIPKGVSPGLYDLWVLGENGISAPRTFAIGNRAELIEVEPNEQSATTPVPMDVVINGRIEKASDSDEFRFEALQGQCVVVECWGERIDSRLRAVLEIFDASGRRLAVNRGYFGADPLIAIRVPADGQYVAKIQDLISSGSAEHYYRLEIGTGPRVVFSLPNVVERDKTSRVVLYGWNLGDHGRQQATATRTPDDFEHVDFEISGSLAHEVWPLPTRLQPAQVVLSGASFSFHFPGSQTPVVVGVSDVPIPLSSEGNHSPSSAQEVVVPCEISGQLAVGDERDWFAISARRGEVIFLEALGQRIQSPVDLQISVFDGAGQRELAEFSDELRNIGGALPTKHLDPSGRWVCPADGRYLIAVRNLVGGLQFDSRRVYRLSIRREEPAFRIIAVPHQNSSTGLNVPRGGREVLDLLAFRRRGMDDAIRVSAKELPAGIECPDVWLGPGVDRTTIVVSADRNSAASFGELKLEATAVQDSKLSNATSDLTEVQRHPQAVPSGTIVRLGTPNGWGRLTSRTPLAVAGESPIRITADGNERIDHHLFGKLQVRHSPGNVLDVAVHIERQDTAHQAAVKLIGVGLPDSIPNQTAIIPAGQPKGYLSFYLPPTLPVGRYSLAVRAETTVPAAKDKTETVQVYSNPVTIDVWPAAFIVEVDPFAVTRARRGEVLRVGYSAQRLNGFIGKMHTELATPGRVTDVVGLRGRGETFVGQTDKGTLQIVINDDAPLGRPSSLRLFTVGVVEDEPTYFGSSLLPLEIVE